MYANGIKQLLLTAVGVMWELVLNFAIVWLIYNRMVCIEQK